MEKLAIIQLGRLSQLLRTGLMGHHPLFDPAAIRDAFEGPEETVSGREADEVGRALVAMAREPLPLARTMVEGLTPTARVALIRLYFRLLDRAREEEGPLVH
jgi:hypothetical protein